jgi:hypothetical protein
MLWPKHGRSLNCPLELSGKQLADCERPPVAGQRVIGNDGTFPPESPTQILHRLFSVIFLLYFQ